MYNHNFGKMDVNSMHKVATHFNQYGGHHPSTASEIGVSGSFMSSLVHRGYAKVVDHKIVFIPAGDDLYRKVEINVYTLTMSASAFWGCYVKCVEEECNHSKSQAETYVSMAKTKLAEVETILNRINSICI